MEKNCIETECQLRHKATDDMQKSIKNIEKALLGSLNGELGIQQKVDVVYDDRKLLKSLLIGSFTFLIALVFNCGALWQKVNQNEQQIKSLSVAIIEMQKEIKQIK